LAPVTQTGSWGLAEPEHGRSVPKVSAREHQVRIQPHDRIVHVSTERPVLEAALSAGLNLPHSCRSGHCASCRARLISGQVHYPRGRPAGITEQEVSSGYVLLCQARADSDLVVEARLIASVAEVEIKTLPCRIDQLERLAPDVLRVLLRLPSVETLRFQPGQYLDVLLEDERRRSFSIASPPHDSELLELHVRRVPGGGFTETLFSSLQRGALLRIEGPLGQFVYREGTRPLILIAGGTGFAPIKSILRHVIEKGIDRELHLYWGARNAVDVYEEGLVLDWLKRYPRLRFSVVLSEAPASSAAHHRLGWVHEAVLADHPNLEPFEVYAAGPPASIEAIRSSFPIGADRLYFDSFDYAER
jgi:CDP-4-dehydro-6-deoxyglucose reductase, E3